VSEVGDETRPGFLGGSLEHGQNSVQRYTTTEENLRGGNTLGNLDHLCACHHWHCGRHFHVGVYIGKRLVLILPVLMAIIHKLAVFPWRMFESS
jgi:hypothetical protein